MLNYIPRLFLFCLGIGMVVLASCGKNADKPGDEPVLIDTPKTLFHPDSVPRLLSNQFAFTEGATVDKAGNVYFTDQPNNKIWKYGLDGKLAVFIANAGRSNGMFLDKSGNLVACADENNQLWQIGIDGSVKVLVSQYMSKLLNGPNDVWIHPNGTIYFTDPYYKRAYWTRTQDKLAERVYYIPQGATQPVRIEDNDIVQPNGIVGTADGKYLFVADYGAGKTYKYAINSNGTLTGRTLFCEQGSDGMVLDNFGNLYLTGNGVTAYNSKGQKVATIVIPSGATSSNVCFGGKDRDILFITAQKYLYALKMNVKGIE